MPLCAVSAIGRDRPGIVAAVTGELLELRGNIEDSQMAILRGHFSMTLIVALPSDEVIEDLRRRLESVRERLELDGIAVSPIDEAAAEGAQATHIISLYGADHPGIVNAAASALAERGITITGLETKLAGENDSLYMMLIEIAAGDAEIGELEAEMRAVADRAGLDISLREIDRTAL